MFAGGEVFVKFLTVLAMWNEFSITPKEDVPPKGTEGTYIYRKIADIFLNNEMMSQLETVAWTPLNPNPVTLRKYLCFQSKFGEEKIVPTQLSCFCRL